MDYQLWLTPQQTNYVAGGAKLTLPRVHDVTTLTQVWLAVSAHVLSAASVWRGWAMVGWWC